MGHVKLAEIEQITKTDREANYPTEDLLVRFYRKKLIRMLLRLTKDHDRAEDLTHDTLIIIINRLREGGLNDPSKLSSYVFSTARFLYLGWIRKRDNSVELRQCLENVEADLGSIDVAIDTQHFVNQLHHSIRKLKTDRDRDILTRHYINDQSKGEICDALYLSPEHYDRVISRARSRLRKSIVEEWETNSYELLKDSPLTHSP